MEDPRLPSTPQDATRRVGDHENVVAVGDHRVEAAGEIVQHERQWRLAATRLELGGVDEVFGRSVIRIDPGVEDSSPRLADHVAWTRRRTVTRHRGVIDSGEDRGVVPRVVACADRRLTVSGGCCS